MTPERPHSTPRTGDPSSRLSIDVRREPGDDHSERDELRAALLGDPPRIPSKYFYDHTGSVLFEEITRLPEYYPTRAERGLLEARAAEIVETTRATTLVELGAGAATKTPILLDAMEAAGRLRCYVPVDVAQSMVRHVAEELTGRYPRLEVFGIVGDFVEHLPELPAEGERRLVAFLGSTIGNFGPEERVEFLSHIAEQMGPEDRFLLGVDLVKPAEVLHAAYNDEAGITAEFNRNILGVMNRVFRADFELDAFEHRAVFEPVERRIEMWLVPRSDQRVTIEELDLVLELPAGRGILTEISSKFDRASVAAMFEGAGLTLDAWYEEDPALVGRFALALGRRRDRISPSGE